MIGDLVIVLCLLAALLAPVWGSDSRDGNDWRDGWCDGRRAGRRDGDEDRIRSGGRNKHGAR